MEKERAPESVAVFTYDRPGIRYARGFSPIFITAAISVLALLAVAGWELVRTSSAQNTTAPIASDVAGTPFSAGTDTTTVTDSNAATSSGGISTLGSAVVAQLEGAYTQLQAAGQYSSSTAVQAGSSLAPYVSVNVQYPAFTPQDIKTDTDTSYARVLQYRSDLRTSLAPLLQNTQPEYEIFAYYVQTNDPKYLTKLQAVAQNYFAAASSTARIVVPQDAVTVQVGILNAMEEFGTTLDAMAAHASDPYASVALLQNYKQAESDMFTSFNALIAYEKQKQP